MADYGIFATKQAYYEYLLEITKRYGETAKAFVQLATLALVLPITFAHQILGATATDNIRSYLNWAMYLSWIGFGLTIVTGAIYQYSAVRLADDFGENIRPGGVGKFPGLLYFLMAASFVLGVLFFCVGVILRFKTA